MLLHIQYPISVHETTHPSWPSKVNAKVRHFIESIKCFNMSLKSTHSNFSNLVYFSEPQVPPNFGASFEVLFLSKKITDMSEKGKKRGRLVDSHAAENAHENSILFLCCHIDCVDVISVCPCCSLIPSDIITSTPGSPSPWWQSNRTLQRAAQNKSNCHLAALSCLENGFLFCSQSRSLHGFTLLWHRILHFHCALWVFRVVGDLQWLQRRRETICHSSPQQTQLNAHR